MKRATTRTIKLSAVGVIAINVIMDLLFALDPQSLPRAPMEAKMGFSLLVSVAWLWFYLAHQTPEGDIDRKPLTGP
jgi:hypothetical protein